MINVTVASDKGPFGGGAHLQPCTRKIEAHNTPFSVPIFIATQCHCARKLFGVSKIDANGTETDCRAVALY